MTVGRRWLTLVVVGVIDRSSLGALQIVRESPIDGSAVYGIDHTDMPFLCYHGSVRRNEGIWERKR